MENQQSKAFSPKTDYTVESSRDQTPQVDEQSSTGGLGGIGDKLSSVASGGTEGSENNQSLLDKGK